jgi:hypothetical protein
MRWFLIVFGLALISVTGCSKAAETVRVSGNVSTAAGKPVSGVRLILEPVEGSKVGRTFGFDLDNEGHFEGYAFPVE